MRTNSVISDPEPLAPTPPVQPAKKQEPQNDFEKLANNSEDYKQFDAYIQQRIKYFTGYLPNGTPVESLSDEQRAVAWGQATVVIRELEMLNNTVQNFKRKK